MPPEEGFRQLSVLGYLIREVSLPILAVSLVATIWGIFNLLRASNPANCRLQLLFSLLPGVIALFAIYSACSHFLALGASPTPPKPADFAEVAGRGMSHGFFGVAGTLLPVFLGMLSSWRSPVMTVSAGQ